MEAPECVGTPTPDCVAPPIPGTKFPLPTCTDAAQEPALTPEAHQTGLNGKGNRRGMSPGSRASIRPGDWKARRRQAEAEAKARRREAEAKAEAEARQRQAEVEARWRDEEIRRLKEEKLWCHKRLAGWVCGVHVTCENCEMLERLKAAERPAR
jgi:hypothetical protein